MYERDQFNQSDSEQSIIEYNKHQKIQISVLKHIPAARKILDRQNRAYQIYSPRCLYSEELARTNKYIMPRIDDASKLVGNRLISMEDALYEHGKMKQKIKDIYNKNQKECSITLWDVYGERELYYSRFEPSQKRNNFASIFMNIAGINLDSKVKAGNFPQIKSKTGIQSHKNNANNNGSLIFDSHFESGNLLYVYKNNDSILQTYDLLLHNDINTKGHNQWFYFKITNTKKNQKVRLNIVNLIKKESLFSYGLKPLTYSQKNSKNGINWIRNGQRICYQENGIKRQHKNQSYYTLSFQYQFRQAYDTVYFAPSYPYTYSQLLYYMDSLLTEKRFNSFISIKKICETVGKNTVNLITISTGKQTVMDSKVIWILARQHPVQTTSGYMVEGIINYLLNLMHAQSSSDNRFYDNYIFKIVPMINPDGVIHGNTRAELTGIDPNRVWKKTSKNITPTIHYIKKLITKMKQETCLVLDLHSHSKKLGCFFYGNYEQSDIKSYRMLPSTICNKDARFCYKNCRFRGGNQNSARKSLFAQLKIPNIYTVECSLLGYIKDNRINEYKISDYQQMGMKIIQTFFELQSQKFQKSKYANKEYPNVSNDFCDAQSARSDSCVSDQEYQQVYNFAKAKKKPKDGSKKIKPRSNTFVYNHKYQLSDVGKKRQNSTLKIKDQLKNQHQSNNQEDKDKVTTLNVKENNQTKLDFKRDFSIKIRGNKTINKNIKLMRDRKKIYQSIKEELSIEGLDKNKTYDEKSIQVEHHLRLSNNNVVLGKIKTQKKLIVVGSSVEEDKIFIGKNQVGIQMNDSKQNYGDVEEKNKNKSASNKLTFKNNRRITELGDSQRIDKSMKQKRGVLMFRN